MNMYTQINCKNYFHIIRQLWLQSPLHDISHLIFVDTGRYMMGNVNFYQN